MATGTTLDPAFAEDVREGLTAEPKAIPPRWLYDERGSALFEEITRLPEYYLTRTERAILETYSDAIVARLQAPTELLELGAGSAEKTRHVIEALIARQGPTTYCPIDISAAAIQMATAQLTERYPELTIRPVVGRYRDALVKLGDTNGPSHLILFIGSSIGNFDRQDQVELLAEVAGAMAPDDRFLLGTDMVKERAVLEAAYNDEAGVTAQFTSNLLGRMNRELDADFDLDAFEHTAWFEPETARIEIHLKSLKDQRVHLGALGLDVDFAEGELLHTENSHKYDEPHLDATLEEAGLSREASWYDERKWFGVHLLTPRTGPSRQVL